jgi:hypothetical protein
MEHKYILIQIIKRNQDCSVCIAMGYELDGQGNRISLMAGTGDLTLLHRIYTGSATHSASYPMGTGEIFQGSKAGHCPPCSAEVTNT